MVGTLGAAVAIGTNIGPTLTSAGSLSAIFSPLMAVTSSLSGSGALTSPAVAAYQRAGALTGVGALAGPYAQHYAVTTALTGLGALSSAAFASIPSSGNLTGSGALSATAIASASPVANLSGGGALSATTTTVTLLPVFFDALGVGNSTLTQVNNLNMTHTATPGARVVAWVLYQNTSGVASLAATYAGQNMKVEASYYLGYVSGYTYLACLSYPAALAGAQTIALTFGYPSNAKANSLSYLNVTQVGGAITNGIGPSTALSVPNVPSAVNHMVSNMLATTPGSTGVLTAYNQTSRWNIITGAWVIPLLLGDAPGAATVSFSATQAVNNYWAGMAVDLWNAPVYLVDSAAALANTVAFPPHQVGDLLVVCCIDVVSTTGVTKPAAGGTVPAWVDIETLNTIGGSIRIAQFKATATNHTTGTWGTASQCYMAVAVIRGQNATTPVGGHGSNSVNGSTNSTAPAITLARPMERH